MNSSSGNPSAAEKASIGALVPNSPAMIRCRINPVTSAASSPLTTMRVERATPILLVGDGA